jgi:hypothetical protein
MGVYRPMAVASHWTAREVAPALLRIGSMSPARLSLSMVASLQCRFCFTRRGHCNCGRDLCHRSIFPFDCG